MKSRRGARWILAGIGILAVAIFGFIFLHKTPAKPQRAQTVPVSVARATVQDTPISVTALGAAQAWKSDLILAQVTGVLLKENFHEGSMVRAGQVLAEVDPSTYEAALTQARGQLQHDQAVLQQARMDLARYQLLLKQDSIASQQAQDQAAVVKQDEGTVLVDQGSVRNAQVNLDRCRITSPISGRAGVRMVDPGNLVSASGSLSSVPSTAAPTNGSSPSGSSSGGSGGSAIVIVNQIQPMAVTFTIPQDDFQRVLHLSDHFKKPLQVQAVSQDTGALLDTGTVGIADNRVDPGSGTVELKANFPNAAQNLWPGQFVNVRLYEQTLPRALVVPLSAVNRGPNGQFVFVIGPGNKAVVRQVKLGPIEGQNAIVESGVQPGDLVVIDGQMILKNGSLVRIAHTQTTQASG